MIMGIWAGIPSPYTIPEVGFWHQNNFIHTNEPGSQTTTWTAPTVLHSSEGGWDWLQVIGTKFAGLRPTAIEFDVSFSNPTSTTELGILIFDTTQVGDTASAGTYITAPGTVTIPTTLNGDIDRIQLVQNMEWFPFSITDMRLIFAPPITWYDVPLGGVDDAFIAGQFNNDSINLPGTITGATKIRLVGTWQGTYSNGDLTIRGYSGEGNHDLSMRYQETFGTENWSGSIDVIIPLQPELGAVDGQTGLTGFFLGGTDIGYLEIFDGAGTGITGINVKLQIDVPFTEPTGGGGTPGPSVNLWSTANFTVTGTNTVTNESFAFNTSDDQWSTATTSKHRFSCTASPKDENLYLRDKQPDWIDIEVANFEKLPGYESDPTAFGQFVVIGVDNQIIGEVNITGNGVFRVSPDFVTFSNMGIEFFVVDTTGLLHLYLDLWDYSRPPKVKFDIISMQIEGVAENPIFWHQDNFSANAGSWTTPTTLSLSTPETQGFIATVTSTVFQGLRPEYLYLDIDRNGHTDELEIRVIEVGKTYGDGPIGLGYSWDSGVVEIWINGQVDDIGSIDFFQNQGVSDSYVIKRMWFAFPL